MWLEAGSQLRRRRPTAAPVPPADLRRADHPWPLRRAHRRHVGRRLVRGAHHRRGVRRRRPARATSTTRSFPLFNSLVSPWHQWLDPARLRPPRRLDRGDRPDDDRLGARPGAARLVHPRRLRPGAGRWRASRTSRRPARRPSTPSSPRRSGRDRRPTTADPVRPGKQACERRRRRQPPRVRPTTPRNEPCHAHFIPPGPPPACGGRPHDRRSRARPAVPTDVSAGDRRPKPPAFTLDGTGTWLVRDELDDVVVNGTGTLSGRHGVHTRDTHDRCGRPDRRSHASAACAR